MSAETAAARARERIRRFGDQEPDALRLARYASLAVRVDAPLLRELRETLLPASDAGIEADLWFSALTESVSSQGFVLDADVVAQLREELAAERVNDEQRALEAATRVTLRAHRHWPESLRLEERVTALALRTPPPAGSPILPEEDIETLLRRLVKAMAESPSRGLEVARWAQRALRRLPKAARETEAALLLALGAAERLGTSIRFADGDRPGRLPDAGAWVLPSGAFSRWTTIGLRRFDDGLEFVEPGSESMTLNLPETVPLFLEIGWSVGQQRRVQTVSVFPGRTVPVPRDARDLRFRSLAGEEFALETVESESAAGSPDEPPKPDTPADPLELAVVSVTPHAEPAPRSSSAGFFVTPDMVITIGNGGSLPRGLACTVRWRDRTIAGWVIAERAPFRHALVRLEEAVPDATLLPRRIHGVTTVNLPWRSAVAETLGIAGEIVRLGAEWHTPDGTVIADVFELSSDARGTRVSWPGAPVVVAEAVVAMIVSADPERILALPMEEIEPFIVEHSNDDALTRSIVTVEVTAPGTHATYATGFFVTPDIVVSFWESVPPDAGSACPLHWRDRTFQGVVIAAERGTVVLRVSPGPPGASVLGRRFDAATSMTRAQWRTADSNHPEITGTFVRPDAEWRAPDGGLEHVLELRTRIGAQSLWCGAPVVVDGWAVGQIVSVQGERIFARPITVLEPLLVESLRPAEHDPVVFVSYAYRDDYGKGAEIDEHQVDRVTNALRAARVNPWLDTAVKGPDDLIPLMNGSEGGVLLWTPVSHQNREIAALELLVFAYRRWAQPDFPIAAFRFRNVQDLPRPVGYTRILDLDETSDAELEEHARRTFGRIGRVPDDAAAVLSMRERLVQLLKKAAPDAQAGEHADAILASGVNARWPQWLPALSVDDLRQVSDIAAAFSFPHEASLLLRAVARGDKTARAFCLNATHPRAAHALVRRAWLGRTPPASVVFEAQPSEGMEHVRQGVLKTVMDALSCTSSEASLLVDRVDATFFVTLTGPLPGPEWIERLLLMLPSAVFLFLVGSDGSNPYPKLVADLRLPPDADMKLDIEDELVRRSRKSEAPSREAPPPPPPAAKKAARKKAARQQTPKTDANAKSIFISASSSNAAVTDRLRRALVNEGLRVWSDDLEITIGSPLRRELQDAIRDSRAVVLVWSEAAARSRWVSFEILTAFHFDRVILPCVTDDTPLPALLSQVVYVDLRRAGDEGVSRLVRAAAEAPPHANPLPRRVSSPSPELEYAAAKLAEGQRSVVESLASGAPDVAGKIQQHFGAEMKDAEQRWPHETRILNLGGYHRKNGYTVKHWNAIQAGRPPADPLLREAEERFLDAALIDPQDVSALNGLASILILERELDAAEFFNERALEMSKRAGIPYDAAEHDRDLIRQMRGRPSDP